MQRYLEANKVSVFKLVTEIGLRNKGVKFDLVEHCKLAERIIKHMTLEARNSVPSFARSLQEYGERSSNTISSSQFSSFCNTWNFKFATPAEMTRFIQHIGARATSGSTDYGDIFEVYFLDSVIDNFNTMTLKSTEQMQ